MGYWLIVNGIDSYWLLGNGKKAVGKRQKAIVITLLMPE
jgi:hypothetical protein